jgi:hypothetical protein
VTITGHLARKVLISAKEKMHTRECWHVRRDTDGSSRKVSANMRNENVRKAWEQTRHILFQVALRFEIGT